MPFSRTVIAPQMRVAYDSNYHCVVHFNAGRWIQLNNVVQLKACEGYNQHSEGVTGGPRKGICPNGLSGFARRNRSDRLFDFQCS